MNSFTGNMINNNESDQFLTAYHDISCPTECWPDGKWLGVENQGCLFAEFIFTLEEKVFFSQSLSSNKLSKFRATFSHNTSNDGQCTGNMNVTNSNRAMFMAVCLKLCPFWGGTAALVDGKSVRCCRHTGSIYLTVNQILRQTALCQSSRKCNRL